MLHVGGGGDCDNNLAVVGQQMVPYVGGNGGAHQMVPYAGDALFGQMNEYLKQLLAFQHEEHGQQLKQGHIL